ncbi:hypothetical protein BZA05DRAFT_384749 [Tricharina praecox]|uniref:uncharacterized protein n=1 Tax=Tricharina praecox TaxID=43433 RepID=UPI00221E71FA|nr:uncharacterized protein BZA05DRAFT_384749 [Tricharina praecox]KAI5857770.1 hypothetical protein BZA05DRAFT_384749 [Tricharina praecox]
MVPWHHVRRALASIHRPRAPETTNRSHLTRNHNYRTSPLINPPRLYGHRNNLYHKMSFNRNLKDQRRMELAIPYIAPETKIEEQSMSDTLSTALPMAAMFTRHRMIGWGAVVFAIQSWLNETPAQLAGGKQPAYFGVGMAFMSLLITYMPIFFPVPVKMDATGTAPAAPVAQ